MVSDLSLELAMAPGYGPVGVLLGMVIVTAIVMLALTHALGPKRHGPVKESPYEAGMPVISDARKRINVRWYLVAVLFLLFDVEVLFLWPWGLLFHDAAVKQIQVYDWASKGFLLGAMGLFLFFLLIGFIYDWRKGVLEWD